MSRVVVLPIIAVIALAIQAITGTEIDQATQEDITNAIVVIVSFVVTIWGVFKNFKQNKK